MYDEMYDPVSAGGTSLSWSMPDPDLLPPPCQKPEGKSATSTPQETQKVQTSKKVRRKWNQRIIYTVQSTYFISSSVNGPLQHFKKDAFFIFFLSHFLKDVKTSNSKKKAEKIESKTPEPVKTSSTTNSSKSKKATFTLILNGIKLKNRRKSGLSFP